MEVDRIYAIGLLGLFAALLVGHQGSKVIRSGYSHWGALCNYADTHLVLPKIFQGRLFFNPTRSEALCHVLHWISVIIFDTYRVTTLSAAEKRTALLAVIHLVPLVVSLQLSHIANSVGLSARTVSKIHASIGLMATLQGVAHASMHLWARHYPADQAVPGILVRPHPVDCAKGTANAILEHDGATGVDIVTPRAKIRLRGVPVYSSSAHRHYHGCPLDSYHGSAVICSAPPHCRAVQLSSHHRAPLGAPDL